MQFADRLHRHLLPLVVLAYVVAAIFPSPGLWAKQCVVVEAGATTLNIPMLLLAVLLFNASVGASGEQLRAVVRRPVPLLAGVGVNLLTPIAFLLILRLGLRAWHNSEEARFLLLGLTVVAAMPVAGSSTAWSQNSGGNTALSLGLVLASTLLSPLTTPLVLAGAEFPTAALGGETGGFLLAVVVLPSVVGLFVRRVAGERAATRIKPVLKPVNALVLLLLCYCNAAVALPQAIAEPDWDYLALVGVATSGLCVTAFASGWLLAKWLRVSEPDGRSLTFGLGMNNNGTGLVLAASTLGSLPWAVVPRPAHRSGWNGTLV
jgi:BASS family bile acid:Na+ symporter